MASKAASAAFLALGGTALLTSGTSFVPTVGTPARVQPSLVNGADHGASSAAGDFACTNTMLAAGLVVAAAGVLRRSQKRAAPRVVASARRDLAVAYEDSGIELFDNGKFAQGLVGGEGAFGPYEFDPAGISKNFFEFVPFFREAELKHGRIAMLAWIGMVVPDFVRIPGERYSFEAIPYSIDAHDKFLGATGVNVQILLWISLVELCCAKKVFEWNSLETAGDYGFGVQFLPKDEEGQKKLRLAELKNGRLAMIAFGGAITQAVITRHPFPWLF